MSEATTSTTPSLTQVIKSAIANHIEANLFAGWLPGRVQSYDAAKRRAVVELLVMNTEEMRDGTRSVTPFALLNNVPIVMPGNQDGAMIKWTPRGGDNLIVHFGARSIDRFLQTGGLVDPDDSRTHDLNDAVAYPVASFDFAHVTDANPQIEFTGAAVNIGGTAPLALNSDLGTVISKVNNIINAYNIHFHPAPGGATSTTASTVSGTLPSVPGTPKLRG